MRILNTQYIGKERIMAEGLMEIGDDNFDTHVLQSEKPALVDFWAPWCGPCRSIAPVVEDLAKKFGNRMTFSKCNIDDNPVTPVKYGIKAIPTLLLFKEGKLAGQITGMTDRTKLEAAIENVL
jgi:thioredoxin 1